MNRNLLLATTAIASLSSIASAQFGSVTSQVDVETPSLTAANLGVAHDPINNQLFVTARGSAGVATPPHSIFVFDGSGALVSTLPQTAATDATVWGYRDGASSPAGQLLFGWDLGIDVYDAVGAAPTSLTPTTSIDAANGPQVITSTIVVAGFGTHRAIAYDFNGNGGNGSLFVANFAADIVEAALDGTVLHTYPNTSGWSAYGIALDADKGTLWINSTPNAGDLAEFTIDRVANTMTPTGATIARAVPGSSQGGLDWVKGGLDGRDCGSDLIGLDQGTPDLVSGYRLEQWDGYDPATEPQMLIGIDGTGFTTDDLFVPDTALTIDVDSTLTGAMSYLFADVSGEPARARGTLGPFPSLWELSFPRPNFINVGGFVGGTPVSFANPFPGLPNGTRIEWQVLTIDPNVPVGSCGLQLFFASSNLARHEIAQSVVATVRAEGGNSFNSDTTSGFFQIEAGVLSATDPIVSVELDWVASTNPAQATMEFDTDQTGMANTFSEGNGGSCAGTYRNGSDVATGLDYANLANNLLNATACATSIAHCEATNQVGTTPDYRTLKWYFTPGSFAPGSKLEFDIDTDGGGGVTGAAMEGMVVTIELQSGAILTGELAVNASVPNGSILNL
ncbi:MAG: hypothetical protein ACI9SE_002997 [Neolewinella sp.]|jgi:hypothetical protein